MIPAVVIASPMEHLPSASFVYQASFRSASEKSKSRNYLQEKVLTILINTFDSVRKEAHTLTEQEADQVIELYRSMFSNEFLVEVMENRDKRLAGLNLFQEESPLMQKVLFAIEDMFYAIIIQTTIGQAEITAFEDEIIAERRKEPAGKTYLANQYLELLEKRLNAIPD
jgi:hypothetical protein